MNITEIEVGFSITESYDNYCNARAECHLRAEIAPDEDAEAAVRELRGACRLYAEQEIDRQLEANGVAAKYDACQRYKVMERRGGNAAIVVPYDQELPPEWESCYYYSERRGYRLAMAARLARERIQCSRNPDQWLYFEYPEPLTAEQIAALAEVAPRYQLDGEGAFENVYDDDDALVVEEADDDKA